MFIFVVSIYSPVLAQENPKFIFIPIEIISFGSKKIIAIVIFIFLKSIIQKPKDSHSLFRTVKN